MNKNRLHHGFTLVELLIVISIIGILAAITMVSYNGIQNRAHDVVVQTDLRSIRDKLATIRAENPNNLPPYDSFGEYGYLPFGTPVPDPEKGQLNSVFQNIDTKSYAKRSDAFGYTRVQSIHGPAIPMIWGISASGHTYVEEGGSIKEVSTWSEGESPINSDGNPIYGGCNHGYVYRSSIDDIWRVAPYQVC